MSDLVAFVRARLDEDERVATTAARPHLAAKSWHTDPWCDGTGERCDLRAGALGQITTHGGCIEVPAAEHAARHDPARVLREVEAKRRMVADLEAQPHVLNQYEWYGCRAMTDDPSGNADLPDVPTGQPCTCGRDDRVRRHLELLALPYADHPDYRAEWAP